MTKEELFEEFKKISNFNNCGLDYKVHKISNIAVTDNYGENHYVCKDMEDAIVILFAGSRGHAIPYFHDKNSIKIPDTGIGDLSDGYHTFNQLYYQRVILFATIINQNKDKAWKSFKHDDGKYCFDSNGEWFIVGIDTKEGPYTYHYEKKYWDLFDCKELECGKKYDGHTEKDVTRLLSLVE